MTEAAARSRVEIAPRFKEILRDPYLALILLAPLYLLLVSSHWIFTTPANIDGWVYHGYFRNLQEYKAVLFPETYYGTRLSAILPGYIAYKILPPLAANYVLHLSLWYALAFAAYYTLKITAGREAALLGTLSVTSSAFFLQSIGWDYIDGPATTYLMLCLAFLTAAACRESEFAMALAGVTFAAVVYANLFTVIFAPVVAVYFVLLSNRARGRRLPMKDRAWSLVWFLSGSLVLTVLLACVNFFIDGHFLFYLPSVQYAINLTAQPNAWKHPVSEWIRRADWLALPAVVAMAGLVALASSRFRKSLLGTAAMSTYGLALLIMIFWEWRGSPVLQLPYYAIYLTPAMLLVIGALLANPPERWKRVSVPFLALAVLAGNSLYLWGYKSFGEPFQAAWPFVPLIFGVALAAGVLSHTWVARGVMAIALVACNLSSARTPYKIPGGRDSFLRITQAAGDVDSVRQGEPVRFWYSRADPRFFEFSALNSIYLWGYSMLGNEFPAIPPKATYPLGSLLVIPSSDSNVLVRARKALKEKNLSAEFVDRRQILDDRVAYSLSFLRVTFDYSGLHPQKLSPCVAQECQNLVEDSIQADLPIAGWIAFGATDDPAGTVVQRQSDRILVKTVASRFGYAAKYGPLVAEADGRYLFRLHYELSSGGILFGALTQDESNWIARANPPIPRRTDQTALLSVEAKAGEPFWLMTTNNYPGGDGRSHYSILELEAYEFPPPAAETQAESATR